MNFWQLAADMAIHAEAMSTLGGKAYVNATGDVATYQAIQEFGKFVGSQASVYQAMADAQAETNSSDTEAEQLFDISTELNSSERDAALVAASEALRPTAAAEQPPADTGPVTDDNVAPAAEQPPADTGPVAANDNVAPAAEQPPADTGPVAANDNVDPVDTTT
jgi:hypothetical protein